MMMFFRKTNPKPLTTNNSTNTSTSSLDTENLTEDVKDSPSTLTGASSIDKPVYLSNNLPLTITTSTSEHLSEKHPGLLRLFDSTVCTVSIVISYLFSSKEPIVQQFLGQKLFDYPHDQVDFYLPQLLNMYIHIQSLSTILHGYITTRCAQSVDFSLQCAWLLEAYVPDQMRVSKRPNDSVRLLFDILYEKYKPRIYFIPTISNNLITNSDSCEDEQNENVEKYNNNDTNCEVVLNQQTSYKKRGYQESSSDASEQSLPIMNGEISRQLSRRPPRLRLGDLNSGHAFDNNCLCFESIDGSQQHECICHAPRLSPEREFMAALVNIGKKLPQVPTKDKITQNLIGEMKRMNMNLPARVWIPLYTFPHHVVRIACTESTVLNSRDRAPYIIYIEVVLCDNVFSSPLPLKQNDLRLRTTRSEENISHPLISINSINSDTFHYETQSLDTESIDPYRSYNNNEDSDIWSTSDEVIGDDQQQSIQKRPGFILQRTNHLLASANHSDTQSIRSTESHTSQQEITPAEIRKRLTEAKATGPLSFDRDPDDPSAAALKEPWARKEQRIRQASPYGHLKEWRLVAAIVKCGDDLRHELLAYQFMFKLKEIWQIEHVPVFVRPVNILVLSNNSGLIEPILNAVSLHQIKKNSKLSLRNYFLREFGDKTSEQFLTAVRNFVQSCSAYSIICYLLQVKDRHNGNILLDDEGHLIHIDFGYMLSATPKNLGFESSPFKITQELVDVMDGLESDMFKYYKILLFRCLIAARKHMDKLMPIVEIMQHGSQLNCFSKGSVTGGLRERFHLNMTDEQLEFDVEKMVEGSLNSLTTRVYDTFQYYTSGIKREFILTNLISFLFDTVVISIRV